jgi:hypothetical protein
MRTTPLVFLVLTMFALSACSGLTSPTEQNLGVDAAVSLPPVPTPVIKTINAEIYPGEPNRDRDFCFMGCPANIVVPRDSDGGYTLKSGTQYTIEVYLWISTGPFGSSGPCCVSYQISYSWDSRSEQGNSSGELIQLTFGFATPGPVGGPAASDQRITIAVQVDPVAGKAVIPIRLVP